MPPLCRPLRPLAEGHMLGEHYCACAGVGRRSRDPPAPLRPGDEAGRGLAHSSPHRSRVPATEPGAGLEKAEP